MYVTLNYKIGVELKYSGAPGVQSLANIDPLVLLVCIVDLQFVTSRVVPAVDWLTISSLPLSTNAG